MLTSFNSNLFKYYFNILRDPAVYKLVQPASGAFMQLTSVLWLLKLSSSDVVQPVVAVDTSGASSSNRWYSCDDGCQSGLHTKIDTEKSQYMVEDIIQYKSQCLHLK